MTSESTAREEDEYFMRLALDQALASEGPDVPVSCLIVQNGQVIASADNRREALQEVTAHAEILAIRDACNTLSTWRLEDCTVYVTLEPCSMCAGALIQARVKRVVFGAFDPKTGACGSLLNLFDLSINHQTEVCGGVLAEDCAESLRKFFRRRRLENKAFAAKSIRRRLAADGIRPGGSR